MTKLVVFSMLWSGRRRSHGSNRRLKTYSTMVHYDGPKQNIVNSTSGESCHLFNPKGSREARPGLLDSESATPELWWLDVVEGLLFWPPNLQKRLSCQPCTAPHSPKQGPNAAFLGDEYLRIWKMLLGGPPAALISPSRSGSWRVPWSDLYGLQSLECGKVGNHSRVPTLLQ